MFLKIKWTIILISGDWLIVKYNYQIVQLHNWQDARYNCNWHSKERELIRWSVVKSFSTSNRETEQRNNVIIDGRTMQWIKSCSQLITEIEKGGKYLKKLHSTELPLTFSIRLDKNIYHSRDLGVSQISTGCLYKLSQINFLYQTLQCTVWHNLDIFHALYIKSFDILCQTTQKYVEKV